MSLENRENFFKDYLKLNPKDEEVKKTLKMIKVKEITLLPFGNEKKKDMSSLYGKSRVLEIEKR